MKGAKLFIFLSGFLFLAASTATPQFPVLSAEEVKSRLIGTRKATIVDSRTPEEYREGHIPGAINIPAQRMRLDAARLPGHKAAPIIFYCRGAG